MLRQYSNYSHSSSLLHSPTHSYSFLFTPSHSSICSILTGSPFVVLHPSLLFHSSLFITNHSFQPSSRCLTLSTPLHSFSLFRSNFHNFFPFFFPLMDFCRFEVYFNSINFNSLQSISIHFNSFQSVSIHFNPFQFFSIRFNSLQSISIHFNPFQSISIHFNPLQFISLLDNDVDDLKDLVANQTRRGTDRLNALDRCRIHRMH